MRLRSYIGLQLAFWLLIAAYPASCFLWNDTREPNVLLIVVDSLRFDALSKAAGAARTPNLQKLAADGVVFPSCFSHSPCTLPANAALLSSREPHVNGVMNNGQPVGLKLPLLAESLSKQHYQTHAVVSLATLWPPATRHDTTSPRVAPELARGIDRGFDSFQESEHELASAEDVNARLLPVLRGLDPQRPWLLLAQYSDPHEPYEAHGTAHAVARVALDGKLVAQVGISDTEWWQQALELPPGRHELSFESEEPFKLRRFLCTTEGRTSEPEFTRGRAMETSRSFAVTLENSERTPIPCVLSAWMHDVPELAQARQRYKLEVEAVDRAVGVLLEELRKQGQYDNTCIVLTSDHGEALGEHGTMGHQVNLYDELLRVPLIIKTTKNHRERPALLKAQHTLVRQIDIVPTVLDLIGKKSLAGAHGISLLDPAERVLVAETHPPEAKSTMFAMRDERYKLIFTANEERYEMYDLSVDTLEVENVFELQGHFRSEWQKQLRALAESAPQGADLRMGWAPHTSARLRAVGY